MWISISTPFVTQLLFIIGYLFYTKVFFNRLISIEKAMITTYGTVKMKKRFFIFNLTIILIYLIIIKSGTL